MFGLFPRAKVGLNLSCERLYYYARSAHSSGTSKQAGKGASNEKVGKEEAKEAKKPAKSVSQLDEELKAAMEGRAGDGGLAGAELEGGKAVGLKRGVRDNMFRYI